MIGAARHHLRDIWRELTVPDSFTMTEIFTNSLQSVKRFIVPAFVQDDIRDTDARTEDEDVASCWMVLD